MIKAAKHEPYDNSSNSDNYIKGLKAILLTSEYMKLPKAARKSHIFPQIS